jgi:hypothetical protein
VRQNRANPPCAFGGVPGTRLVAPIATSYPNRHRLAFARPLYRRPVNHLETTPSLALVSNLSESYNRL